MIKYYITIRKLHCACLLCSSMEPKVAWKLRMEDLARVLVVFVFGVLALVAGGIFVGVEEGVFV